MWRFIECEVEVGRGDKVGATFTPTTINYISKLNKRSKKNKKIDSPVSRMG